MCGDVLINRWPHGITILKKGRRGDSWTDKKGSMQKGRCKKNSPRKSQRAHGGQSGKKMGCGLGVCARWVMGKYVCTCCRKRLGGVRRDTRLDKQWMSQQACVYVCVCVCVICEVVTGEVCFGSAHQLAAKTNNPQVQQGGWTQQPKKINPKKFMKIQSRWLMSLRLIQPPTQPATHSPLPNPFSRRVGTLSRIYSTKSLFVYCLEKNIK